MNQIGSTVASMLFICHQILALINIPAFDGTIMSLTSTANSRVGVAPKEFFIEAVCAFFNYLVGGDTLFISGGQVLLKLPRLRHT
ncbi:unnamed protein product [Orchesella dallaii]|uniref:Uncharacterized protein n=1 Tax=Orchesella dallaii TaxID=48710 RepID=A0ABP1S1U7_9HEXA